MIHSGLWPWGQVNSTGILGYGPGTGWASLAESQVDWQREHLALRLEAMDPGWGPPGALAFSYAHDVGPQERMSLAVGAMVGGQLANPSLPAALEARVFVRLRPPAMP